MIRDTWASLPEPIRKALQQIDVSLIARVTPPRDTAIGQDTSIESSAAFETDSSVSQPGSPTSSNAQAVSELLELISLQHTFEINRRAVLASSQMLTLSNSDARP